MRMPTTPPSSSPFQQQLPLPTPPPSTSYSADDPKPTPGISLAHMEPSASSVSYQSTDAPMCSGQGKPVELPRQDFQAASRPRHAAHPQKNEVQEPVVDAVPPVGGIFRPWESQIHEYPSPLISATRPPSFVKPRWAGIPPRPAPRGMKPRCLFPQDELSISVMDVDDTPQPMTAASRLHHERNVVASVGLNPDRDFSLSNFLEDVFTGSIADSPSPINVRLRKSPLDCDIISPEAKRRKLECMRSLV